MHTHLHEAPQFGRPPDTSSTPLAYSPQQAAAATSLSLRTITAAIAAGQLSTLKVGRRRLILREDLDSYLRSRAG
jgi:excisionase family DNA binding protein